MNKTILDFDPLCDFGMDLSTYVAKRYQDKWAVRHHKDARVRAHYEANYKAAVERMNNHIAECAECTRTVRETA